MSQTLFLSTVSREFGSLRTRLANLIRCTHGAHVRLQEDFAQRGVVTLQMLEEEIGESDIVIHVIGAEPGSPAPAAQVEDLLARHPEFADRFPDVAEAGRQGALPYTQWEAWLALFSGKRLCSYVLADRELDPAQAQHVEQLKALGAYPKPVDNDDDLYDKAIGSLIELAVFTQDDIDTRRPLSLPYPSLGTLFKGRDAFLGQLRRSLAGAGNGRATAITGRAVHGLGGVGKTRLAVEYAWQHADDYSAVLCVVADSPVALRQNLAELTGPFVLDLPEHAAPEEDARVAAALRWLNAHPRWFLIFDNVDSEDAAEAVEETVTRLREGHVIITSRLNRWGDHVQPLELDVLDADNARAFLLERTAPKPGGKGRRPTPRRGILRSRPSQSCHPPQQPGATAPGHEPS